MKTQYDNYKNTELWLVVEKTILELEENKDIKITTGIDYVIGYIVKNISNKPN